MNSNSLNQTIDYISSSGAILSVEQKAALQSSLVILKSQQKFKSVEFWGKIIGTRNEYFIVQGIGNDQLKDRKTLYSLDCIKWGLMPNPNEETRRKCVLIKGRFTGDPSHEYEYSEKNVEEEQTDDEENIILVKEEDRLAIVIENICRDAAVVPRGGYLRTPLGEVIKNKSFEGYKILLPLARLSVSEGLRLSSYFHFREPILLHKKSLFEQADLDKAIDFLDSIDTDIPQNGSWSIQAERGNSLIVLRSLHWLGFTFYHVPGSSNHGFAYFGTGEKNVDLPFML